MESVLRAVGGSPALHGASTRSKPASRYQSTAYQENKRRDRQLVTRKSVPFFKIVFRKALVKLVMVKMRIAHTLYWRGFPRKLCQSSPAALKFGEDLMPQRFPGNALTSSLTNLIRAFRNAEDFYPHATFFLILSLASSQLDTVTLPASRVAWRS